MFASNISSNFLTDTELELMTKNELILVIRNFQRQYAEREKEQKFQSNVRMMKSPTRDLDNLSEIKKGSISDMSIDSKFEGTEDIGSTIKYKLLSSFLINKAIEEGRDDLLEHVNRILNDKLSFV